jgi:uncharacterized protein YjbI with pentapeptide repeats
MIINGYEIKPYANLKGADLRGAFLEGAYLRGVVLEGASLEGASLEGTILEKKDDKDLRIKELEDEVKKLKALRPRFGGAFLL